MKKKEKIQPRQSNANMKETEKMWNYMKQIRELCAFCHLLVRGNNIFTPDCATRENISGRITHRGNIRPIIEF